MLDAVGFLQRPPCQRGLARRSRDWGILLTLSCFTLQNPPATGLCPAALPPFNKGGLGAWKTPVLLQRPPCQRGLARRSRDWGILLTLSCFTLQNPPATGLCPAALPPLTRGAWVLGRPWSCSKGPLVKGGWHGAAVAGGFPHRPPQSRPTSSSRLTMKKSASLTRVEILGSLCPPS